MADRGKLWGDWIISKELGIGIVGRGEISGLSTWGYRIDDRARIVAVSDTNTERAGQCVSEWKAEKVYTDYRELLDDKSVDAALILTLHDLHKQMVVDALDAGKHVSVQKPMARNAAECMEMIEAAKRAKGKFNRERVGGDTMFDDMHHKHALGLFFGGPVEKVSAFIEKPGMFLDTPATVI